MHPPVGGLLDFGCELLRRLAGGAAQRVKRRALGIVGGGDAGDGVKRQIREFGALQKAAGDEPLGDGAQGSAATPGACGGTGYLGGAASAVIVTTAGRPLVTAVVVPPLPATSVGAGGETYAHHQYEQRRQDAGSKHGHSGAPPLRYAPGRPSSSVGLNFGVSHSHRMVLERIVLRCVGRMPPTSQRMMQRISRERAMSLRGAEQ